MPSPNEILKQYWGFDKFRPLQEEIINSVLHGEEVLAILPTGGGKSICFQVPAMCLEGICLVVSPLVALMKDQVGQLQKRGIKAAAVFAGMSPKEIDILLDNCIYGNIKLLYVSPERLETPLFLERADKMNISLLAVDEAHCISQWGYDFRPPYLKIAAFREQIQVPKIIALTASATATIKKDILKNLEIEQAKIFQKSFARKNLSYSVFNLESKEKKLLEILNNVHGSSIVYVYSRKRTKKIAEWLQKCGISASFYHAGLTGDERNIRQDKWINNQIRVIVATNAFGMGIDKPDVRTVIHLDITDSLEAYYQEAGRAGRDERKAYAIALYCKQDLIDAGERVLRAAVDISIIKRVYQALANKYKLAVGSGTDTSFDFNYSEFVENFNLPVLDSYYALNKLQDEGLISLSDNVFTLSKVIFLVTHDELYKFQIAHVKLDPLIKVLLRLYGGELHTEFMSIRESDIARLLKVSKQVIINDLNSLHQFEVLEYHRSSNKPQIHFLTARRDVNSLGIDIQMLAWRKKVIKEKFDAVIQYLENSDQCRTRMLQAYFDEHTDENCGVCDYCLKHKKKEKPSISLLKLLSAIPDEGILLEELSALTKLYPDEILKKLRDLLENESILIERENFIRKNDSPI